MVTGAMRNSRPENSRSLLPISSSKCCSSPGITINSTVFMLPMDWIWAPGASTLRFWSMSTTAAISMVILFLKYSLVPVLGTASMEIFKTPFSWASSSSLRSTPFKR